MTQPFEKLIHSGEREEWLKLRREGIGGSDAPAILGLVGWASPMSVQADKWGLIEEAEALPTFPLIICRCDECGTIQLTETVAPEILFKEYVWVTGTSEGARNYSKVFCERLLSRCPAGPLFVVEVASNDGTFLKRFVERGERVLGVDPAQNIAAMAERDGARTLAEFFGLEIAKRIVEREGEADAVFARNVISHVANANDVVGGIAHCLKADGTGANGDREVIQRPNPPVILADPVKLDNNRIGCVHGGSSAEYALGFVVHPDHGAPSVLSVDTAASGKGGVEKVNW